MRPQFPNFRQLAGFFWWLVTISAGGQLAKRFGLNFVAGFATLLDSLLYWIHLTEFTRKHREMHLIQHSWRICGKPTNRQSMPTTNRHRCLWESSSNHQHPSFFCLIKRRELQRITRRITANSSKLPNWVTLRIRCRELRALPRPAYVDAIDWQAVQTSSELFASIRCLQLKRPISLFLLQSL